MKPVPEVIEVKECEDPREVNRYLENKKDRWILLDILMDTQLCFSKVDIVDRQDKEKIFTKVVPHDKLIKIYVIGKLRTE